MIKTLKYSTINGASGLYKEELYFDNELKTENNKQLDMNDRGTDLITKLRSGIDNDIEVILDNVSIGNGAVEVSVEAEAQVVDSVTEETAPNFVAPEIVSPEVAEEVHVEEAPVEATVQPTE